MREEGILLILMLIRVLYYITVLLIYNLNDEELSWKMSLKIISKRREINLTAKCLKISPEEEINGLSF